MSDLAVPARGAPAQAIFRVLVVDDDPDMAGFLARLLKASGMAVETVGDGKSALASVASRPPDLILLDVMLPDMSGFPICERPNPRPRPPSRPLSS
jgi:two-component system, OmpR family, response regulator